MKTKHLLFILALVAFGELHAQFEPYYIATYSYDNAGNRKKREWQLVADGLVRKDTTVKTLPMSMDSLLITGLDLPEDTITKQTTTLTEEKEQVFKTWIGEQNVAIYPNPTQGYLTIGLKNFDEVKSCLVEIIDMNGKVVYQSTSAQRVYSVDLSNRATGNYYINLRVNGQIGSFVVVKE